ncbi:hypothetical protein [Comamonas composti]|uniref:hypothetical protein n=1 Tax=Comamonas composti TaxID=408558 RepID=UPI0004083EE1|nr:hypothetical protein [Comamonas composti]
MLFQSSRSPLAMVLASAALVLGACDSKTPPTPVAAEPAQVVPAEPAAPLSEPVSEPQAQPAAEGTPAMVQKRVPYEAKGGSAQLASLEQYLGKYPNMGVNFLEEGVLADRLKALMGADYETLVRNMGTVGPLTQDGKVWSLVGLRPHDGGSEAAAVVIDPERNGLRVWLLTAGTQTDYSDVQAPDIAWPQDVQAGISNVEP